MGQRPRRSEPGLEQGLALVQYAVSQIAQQGGALSIGALSDQIGISHKHLITQFTQLVGGTPKELARLYRMQHALDSVDASLDPGAARPLTWARVAQQAGYYDEAHFDRDFRALTSQTPSTYLRALRQVHAEHPDIARALKFLPAE